MGLSCKCVVRTCLILTSRITNRHIHLRGWTTIKGINQEINTFKGGGVEGPPAHVVTGQSPLPKIRPPLRPLTLYQKCKVRVSCAGGVKRRGRCGAAFLSGLRYRNNLRCSLRHHCRRHFIHYCHCGVDVRGRPQAISEARVTQVPSLAEGNFSKGGGGYLPAHPPGVLPGEEAQALDGPRVHDRLPAAVFAATPPGRHQCASSALTVCAVRWFIPDMGVEGQGGGR